MRSRLLTTVLLTLYPLLASATPPANDKFAKATVIPPGGVADLLVDNAGATAERGEPFVPGISAFLAKQSVWYSFTAPADGTLVVGNRYPVAGSTFPNINLFTGTALANLRLARTDTPQANFYYSEAFNATRLRAGQKCYIQVDRLNFGAATHTEFHMTVLFSRSGFFRFVDPPPVVGVEPFTYYEGQDSTIPITVGRLGGTEGTVGVDYAVSADPRLSGPLTGTLTFGPGVTRQTFTLTLANDAVKQAPAFPVITLTNAGGGSAIMDDALQFAIEDDDNAPANDDFANAKPLTGSGTETAPAGVATAEFGEVGGSRTVWYRYTPAADGLLLIDLPKYVPGQLNRIGVNVFQGPSLADLSFVRILTADYPNNQFRYGVEAGVPIYLQMTNVTNNYSLTPTMNYTFTSEAGVLFPSFGTTVYHTAAHGTTLQIPVVRVGSAVGALTVDYSFQPTGSAVATKDFQDTSGSINFAAGARTANIPLQILKHHRKSNFAGVQVKLDHEISGAYLGSPLFVALSNGGPPSLTANFAASLAPAAGQTLPAFLRLQVSRTGMATGQLTYAGKPYPFRTPFVLGGAGLAMALTGPTPVTLGDGLTLTLTSGDIVKEDFYQPALAATLKRGATVLASVEDSISDLALVGKRIASAYTIALQPGVSVPAALATPGSASLRVTAGNSATLVGTLADGTKFSAGGKLVGQLDATFNAQNTPVFPFGVSLYNGGGELHGELLLSTLGHLAPGTLGDGAGVLTWTHPATTEVATAFTGDLTALISNYLIPAGQLVLGGGTQPSTLTVTDGGTAQVFPFTLGARNVVTFDPAVVDKPALHFDAVKGLFSGTLKDGTSFSGAVLRNLEIGRGSAQFGAGTSSLHSGPVTVVPPQ
jgi:hypothetical protein